MVIYRLILCIREIERYNKDRYCKSINESPLVALFHRHSTYKNVSPLVKLVSPLPE